MVSGSEIIAFVTVEELWAWLSENHGSHPGGWVQLQEAGSAVPSIGVHDLLEAGIADGWSESTRRSHDETSYLQRFTPRRPLERRRRGTSPSRRGVQPMAA